jgi:hypothetical protein
MIFFHSVISKPCEATAVALRNVTDCGGSINHGAEKIHTRHGLFNHNYHGVLCPDFIDKLGTVYVWYPFLTREVWLE